MSKRQTSEKLEKTIRMLAVKARWA